MFLNWKVVPIELLDGAVVDVVVEGPMKEEDTDWFTVDDDGLAVEGEERATK